MFLSVSTFLQAWEKEAESTQRILDALTDDSLNNQLQLRIVHQGESLGICATIFEMMARGLELNRNGATSKLIGQGIVAGVFGDINTDNKNKG